MLMRLEFFKSYKGTFQQYEIKRTYFNYDIMLR